MLRGTIAVKITRGTRLAAAGLCLLAVAAGCSHEEKKTATQTYAPPKLRSAAEREATATAVTQTADRRPQLGMRMSEVEAIQGKPDRVDEMGYPGTGETIAEWRYYNLKNGCRTIVFSNKRVSLLRECVGTSSTAATNSP